MVIRMAKIIGRNPVNEAIIGGRNIHEIIFQEKLDTGRINEIKKLAREEKIKIKEVSAIEISRIAESDNHQGVVALAEDIKLYTLEEFIEDLPKSNGFLLNKPRFLILDQIQDPHNFGALIRTAQSAGFTGVIFHENRFCDLTTTVLKASSGAAEHIPLIKVKNLNRAIEDLKAKGVWIAGADMEGEQQYFEADFTGAIGIVIGNEGSGLRRLVKENCDFLVSIPVTENPGSLNASVAAGILIYETVRQRKIKLD